LQYDDLCYTPDIAVNLTPKAVGELGKGNTRVIGSRPDFLERGTIVQADLDPRHGSEQAGLRPAIIVSATPMTAGTTVIVVPFTTTLPTRPRPYVVVLTPAETGLPEVSAALIQHLRVLDKQFIKDRYRGRVVDAAMVRIDEAIRIVLNV
jgi:mRNA-degrading endonuclease toxin of MazEF toxin-antitoxin module